MSGSLYSSTIQSAASTYGVPPNLLTALIAQESSFNPSAQNGNAYGIAQFMPGTASQYGVDVTDPTSSINGAAHYLSDLFSQTGSWLTSVQKYGTVPSNGSLTSGQQNVANIAGGLDGNPNAATSNTGWLSWLEGIGPWGAVTGLFGGAEGKIMMAASNGVFRVAIGIIALLFLIIGLAALALKSHPTQVITNVIKKVGVEE